MRKLENPRNRRVVFLATEAEREALDALSWYLPERPSLGGQMHQALGAYLNALGPELAKALRAYRKLGAGSKVK